MRSRVNSRCNMHCISQIFIANSISQEKPATNFPVHAFTWSALWKRESFVVLLSLFSVRGPPLSQLNWISSSDPSSYSLLSPTQPVVLVNKKITQTTSAATLDGSMQKGKKPRILNTSVKVYVDGEYQAGGSILYNCFYRTGLSSLIDFLLGLQTRRYRVTL